jgi:hypothetical protein
VNDPFVARSLQTFRTESGEHGSVGPRDFLERR